MSRWLSGVLMLGLFVLTIAEAESDGSRRLDFDVFINEKKIGTHYFEMDSRGDVDKVLSVANFKYTVFFIPAYRYQHSNEERWSDNCLQKFNAKTNVNGKRIEVSGERAEEAFRVVGGKSTVDLPECVMSFAYWNPSFLAERRLLNPQTGDYEEVEVREVGAEQVQVRGESIPATRFELSSPNAQLTLWYSSSDEWLALESTAKSGHIIRYELT